MTTLDDLRLRVVPGDGVVLRAPGVTAVAFPSSDQHQVLVTAFLDAARGRRRPARRRAQGGTGRGRAARRSRGRTAAGSGRAPTAPASPSSCTPTSSSPSGTLPGSTRRSRGGTPPPGWTASSTPCPSSGHWPATGRVPPTSGPTSRPAWPGATDVATGTARAAHRSRRRTCRCRRSSPTAGANACPPGRRGPSPAAARGGHRAGAGRGLRVGVTARRGARRRVGAGPAPARRGRRAAAPTGARRARGAPCPRRDLRPGPLQRPQLTVLCQLRHLDGAADPQPCGGTPPTARACSSWTTAVPTWWTGTSSSGGSPTPTPR